MEKAFCDYLQNTPECHIVWTELLKEEKAMKNREEVSTPHMADA